MSRAESLFSRDDRHMKAVMKNFALVLLQHVGSLSLQRHHRKELERSDATALAKVLTFLQCGTLLSTSLVYHNPSMRFAFAKSVECRAHSRGRLRSDRVITIVTD